MPDFFLAQVLDRGDGVPGDLSFEGVTSHTQGLAEDGAFRRCVVVAVTSKNHDGRRNAEDTGGDGVGEPEPNCEPPPSTYNLLAGCAPCGRQRARTSALGVDHRNLTNDRANVDKGVEVQEDASNC